MTATSPSSPRRAGTDAPVVVERARVLLEVVPPVELDRVHEDRHDHALRVPACLGDEGEVAVMERTHRRDEGDPAAGGPLGVGPRLHGARLGERRHAAPVDVFGGANACASVGNAPVFTSRT